MAPLTACLLSLPVHVRRRRLASRPSGLVCSACSCGIDLGTTNSCVAVIVDGRPVVVPLPDGRRTLPSVVAYTQSGDVLVGQAATQHSLVDPQSTFSSVKRFIGRKFKDVTQDAARVQFKVVAGDDGLAALLCPTRGDAVLRPEEVSCEVLRPLLLAASQALGKPITRAVVTVPAYFDDAQRQATLRAARLAGLERVKLVREPVAAALAYGVDKAGDATVLVFDLGGGTLDVSLLAVGGPTVEVLATSGDTRLGGDDFDDAVARWMAAQLVGRATHSIAALHPAARALREALTGREAVTARLDATTTVTLSRAQLEGLVGELLGRMARPLEEASWTAGVDLGAARAVRAATQATAEAHLTADGRSKGGGKRGRRAADRVQREAASSSRQSLRQVDTVILVGGATRMPCVQAMVSSAVAQPVTLGAVDPDEAVALGAALHAGCLDGTVSDVEALETWQAALMRALVANAAARQSRMAEGIEEEALTRAAHDAAGTGIGATPERLPTADEQVQRGGLLSSRLAQALESRVRVPGRRLGDDLGGALPEDDTQYDALDLEDIAALGLAEMEEDDSMVVFQDEQELRLALGDDAFRRLQATRVDDVPT